MPKAYRWVTEIMLVEDRKVTDKVIGKKYNFGIYFETKSKEPVLGLGRPDYATLEEEFNGFKKLLKLKPEDISNTPPPDYRSLQQFESERPLRDDDLE